MTGDAPGIKRAGPDFSVDAALLAEAFGVTQAQVQQEMRAGGITSRCEAGVDEDEGRWRLTFHRGERAVRFIVDDAGQVLTRVSFPVRTA